MGLLYVVESVFLLAIEGDLKTNVELCHHFRGRNEMKQVPSLSSSLVVVLQQL